MRGWMAALRLIGLGWFVVASILLGLLGGLWLDGLFHLGFPLFMLVGLLLGVGAAFVGAFRLVMLVFVEQDK